MLIKDRNSGCGCLLDEGEASGRLKGKEMLMHSAIGQGILVRVRSWEFQAAYDKQKS